MRIVNPRNQLLAKVAFDAERLCFGTATYAKTNAKQNSTSRIFSGVVAKFEVLSSVVRAGEPLKSV